MGLANALETNVDYLVGTSDDPRAFRRVPLGPLTADEEELVRVYRQIPDDDFFKQRAHDQLRDCVELARHTARADRLATYQSQSGGQEGQPQPEDAPVGQ